MTDIHTKTRACQTCHRIMPIEALDVEWRNGYRRWVCAGGCQVLLRPVETEQKVAA